MVELVEIEKSFEYPVLKKITHTFEEGKIYIIKGISGCGKSTLLNILGGLDREYSGSLSVDGKILNKLNQKEFSNFRERVSYIFQNSLLISKLTIRENLLFIKEDNAKIQYYAKKLGVYELLDKYPGQLSGGERQRISLIRAMLKEPKIIIADEPTASLDHENSVKIATLLRELTNDTCVTIIATHEDCFDGIADEILSLNYGSIDSVKEMTPKVESIIEKQKENMEKQEKGKNLFWNYAFKRNKEKYTLKKLLPSIMIFFIVMVMLSIQNNIQSWYISTILKEYPATMFSVTNEQCEELKTQYELNVFEDYTYPLEGVGVYPLFEKEDSGIAYGNVIQFGEFPKTDHELIASQNYISNCLKLQNYEDAIGKTVLLGNKSFKVVGVLSNIDQGEQSSLFHSNVYYTDWNKTSLFIPYNALKQIGTKVEMQYKMVKLKNLYSSPHIYEGLRNYFDGPINEWDDKLVEMQYLINSIFGVFLAGTAILGMIAVIFIKNEVQLELYYRRKEMGYLQIFGLPKKRILDMVVFERSARSLIALVASIILYTIAALGIQIVTGYSTMVKLSVIGLTILIIGIYIIGITWIPCKKFLKKDVIKLII